MCNYHFKYSAYHTCLQPGSIDRKRWLQEPYMNDIIPVYLLCTKLALGKMSTFMECLPAPMCKIRVTGTRFPDQSEQEEGKQEGVSCLKVNKELVQTSRRVQSMLMNGSCWGPTGPLAECLILILGGCYTLCRNEPLSSSRFHEDVLCCYCLFFSFLLVSTTFLHM